MKIATTAIFPIHTGKYRSVTKAIKDVTDYLADQLKTNFGAFISSYECTPETVDLEFNLSKQEYFYTTNRSQGENDVVAYHARQSFLPGEVTPEEANRLGYELAMRFTKGRHAFIVTTHVDTNCVHNHILWNSTRLDCRKKFRNFIGSAFALRRCSDVLCAENGFLVIRNPKASRGKNYSKYMYSGSKPPSYQEQIRNAIDEALNQSPKTFEDFIGLIEAAGITAKRRGKKLRFKVPGQKQFTRLDTLKGDYTEESIRERIAGVRRVTGTTNATAYKPNLLIDIQAKLQEGKSAGYAHWASVQNLKSMARTLIYLQERGLDDYDVLKSKTESAKIRFNEISERIKVLDEQLSANAYLQKQIVTYSKSRATYTEYRKAGYSKAFRAAHEADIILHQAAKKTFDELGYGKKRKLPKVAELRAEYAPLLDEKKQLYKEFRKARGEMKELVIAKANVDKLLNIKGDTKTNLNERTEL